MLPRFEGCAAREPKHGHWLAPRQDARHPAPRRDRNHSQTLGRDLTTVAEFTVAEGETIPFVLGYAPSNGPVPPALDAKAALQTTEFFGAIGRRAAARPAIGRSR